MCRSTAAQNIKHYIQKSGMKQYAVAEKAGYSPKAFSDMLNGRKIITAADIPPIAEALNVTANDLLVRKENNRPRVRAEERG